MYKKLINDLKGKKYPNFHVKTELKIKAELSDALSDADFELSELKKAFKINSSQITYKEQYSELTLEIEIEGNDGSYGLEIR